jgi:hypothetical protein
MVATFVSMALVWGTLGGIGGHFGGGNGWILPPGPGYGWGFPNGNPDGYGYRDDGVYLPLWSDRTSEYYFPRYFMVPPDTLFFPTYYNAYISRGQRYIPYAGCGGAHPAGYAPIGSAVMPPFPYDESSASGPRVQIPTFTGNVGAPPVPSGSTGLTP